MVPVPHPGAASGNYQKWLGNLDGTKMGNESSALVSTPHWEAVTHMASRAQVFYLPVGIKHHLRAGSDPEPPAEGPLGPRIRGKEGEPWGFHP